MINTLTAAVGTTGIGSVGFPLAYWNWPVERTPEYFKMFFFQKYMFMVHFDVHDFIVHNACNSSTASMTLL